MSCVAVNNGIATPFCEGRWGGLARMLVVAEESVLLPEWTNCVTCIGMAGIGMYQLGWWTHTQPLLQLITALFVANSALSFAVHFTAQAYWRFLDGLTVVIPLWVAATLLVDHTLEAAFATDGPYSSPRSECPLSDIAVNPSLATLPPFLGPAQSLMWVVSVSCIGLIALLALESCDTGKLPVVPGYFEVGCLIPCTVYVGVVVYWYHWKWSAIQGTDTNKARSWKTFLFGLLSCLLGVSCWLLTEHFCNTIIIFKWFPGHAIWHLAMAYGACCVLHTAIFILAGSGCVPHYVPPQRNCCRLAHAMFPRITYSIGYKQLDNHRTTVPPSSAFPTSIRPSLHPNSPVSSV